MITNADTNMATEKECIQFLETYLSSESAFVCSSRYSDLCRRMGELNFKDDYSYSKGIYYLSEVLGSYLRSECILHHRSPESADFSVTSEAEVSICEITEKYLSLNNEYASQQYDGLVKRLKEMPKEWTLIQINLPFIAKEKWSYRRKNDFHAFSEFHIIKYQCGESFTQPCHVLISQEEQLQSVLNSMKDVEIGHGTNDAGSQLKQKREQACVTIEAVVEKLSTVWFKQWICLLSGKLVNQELDQSIVNKLNEVYDKYDSSRRQLSEQSRHLLYQIASGCCYVSNEQIKDMVKYIVKKSSSVLCTRLISKIQYIRRHYPELETDKRYPVILMLDQKLEILPWEMVFTLRDHAVCRVPSVHFLHALYKKEERYVVNGNRVIKLKDQSGYYLINPDRSLNKTERLMTSFISKRLPNWKGITKRPPTDEEYRDAITKHDIFLYCGHGNGITYFKMQDGVFNFNIRAMSLLYGCSSVKSIDNGGRLSFTGLFHRLIGGGCYCIFGALWNVTTKDLDHAALSLFNIWLPGPKENLKEMFPDEFLCSLDFEKEPEFLRAVNSARNTCVLYLNKASLATWGIPVKIEP